MSDGRAREGDDGVNVTSVHYQPTDPGTRWVKDPGIVIDAPDDSGEWKILTPNVIDLPGSGYRMYYTLSGPGRDYGPTPANILSAFSPDGDHWQSEPGIRLAPHEPEAGVRVVCPDVIPLEGGGYRMYFEAQPRDRPSSIGSAISDDGLTWEPEPGARFADGRRLGSPRCIPVAGEDPRIRYRLYFHSYTHPLRLGLEAGNNIVSAASADGLTFQAEPGVRIPQEGLLESFSVYAPEVLRLGDGTYRMYYAGWQVEPVRGRIFSATSRDGLDWAKDREPNVDFGGRYDAEKCSEPCVTRLPDGRYRMFYEACDTTAVWRILSCTAAPR